MVTIDNKNLFYESLKTGINLFVGAGFAVLESPSGQILPDGNILAERLRKKFQLSDSYEKNLTRISTFLKRNRKSEFIDYLKSTYTVHDYNALYKVLNKINLKSIVTTNIDNLIPTVIDDSSRYYLSNIRYNGPAKKDGCSLPYIPLHGDVLVDTTEMVFGNFEVADANNINRGPFAMMFAALLEKPTLFWGYGFNDGGVVALIGQILEIGKQNIWIQVRNSKDGDFYKDLGCNVIVADTEQLLTEIDQNLDDTILEQNNMISDSNNPFWKSIAIPSLNQVESLPINDFYEQGKTHWYYALANKAYPTRLITTVIDASIANKNTIVVGIPLGGKTMLLMQIACIINKPCYFVSDLNEEKAKLIRNNTVNGDGVCIILIDNCAENMAAYKVLAECSKIRTIATSDDYMYESSKHLLDKVAYKKLDIPDIDRNEAQRIFDNIPKDLRKNTFAYKQNAEEKYSILELMSANVKNIFTKRKVENILKRIKRQNYKVFEIILMTAYLVNNKSVLTTDILVAYFNTTDVDFVRNIIAMVQSYLTEINVALDGDDIDQDYYSLRSSLFVMYTYNIALQIFKKDFANIVRKFIFEVPPTYIYKYSVFKRSAYDAQLFLRLFDKNADEVYQEIYKYESNAYTLQQQALYKAYTGRFPEAFSDIEEAMHRMPGNFSIKNARAIILFEANKDKTTDDALQALNEAMAILEQCYTSDKRKIYHAQKYAEFALHFVQKFNDKAFLEKAYQWIGELIENGDSTSRRTKRLYKDLKEFR